MQLFLSLITFLSLCPVTLTFRFRFMLFYKMFVHFYVFLLLVLFSEHFVLCYCYCYFPCLFIVCIFVCDCCCRRRNTPSGAGLGLLLQLALEGCFGQDHQLPRVISARWRAPRNCLNLALQMDDVLGHGRVEQGTTDVSDCRLLFSFQKQSPKSRRIL